MASVGLIHNRSVSGVSRVVFWLPGNPPPRPWFFSIGAWHPCCHRSSLASQICDFWKPPLRPTLDTPLSVVCRRANFEQIFIRSLSLCCVARQICRIIIWDICLISRDAGHLMKMRDCPAKCGTVDMYESHAYGWEQILRYSYSLLKYFQDKVQVTFTHTNPSTRIRYSSTLVRYFFIFLNWLLNYVTTLISYCLPEMNF